MLSLKPKSFLSKDFKIYKHNQKIGSIKYPFFSQMFFSFGYAKLIINDEYYFMSIPVKDTGLIGKEKSLDMTLYKGDEEIAKAHFSQAYASESFMVKTDAAQYDIKLKETFSHQIFLDSKTMADINWTKSLAPACEITIKEVMPQELAVFIAWAALNPPRWI